MKTKELIEKLQAEDPTGERNAICRLPGSGDEFYYIAGARQDDESEDVILDLE